MGKAHTTCTVCNKGLDIDESKRCPICRHHVHSDCYNEETKCCDDCSKELDKR